MKIKKYSNTIATLLFVGISYYDRNNYSTKLNELELSYYMSVSYQACQELESTWKISKRSFKKVFYKYSRQFHPDKNSAPRAEEIYKIISDCYTEIPSGKKKTNSKLDRDRYLREFHAKKDELNNKNNLPPLILYVGYLLIGNYKKIKPWQFRLKALAVSGIEKAASVTSGAKALAVSFKTQLVNQYEKGNERFYKFYKKKLIKEIKKSWEDNRTIEKNIEEILGSAWENDFENLANDQGIINAKRGELIGKINELKNEWVNYLTTFQVDCPVITAEVVNKVKECWEKNILVKNAVLAYQAGVRFDEIRRDGWVKFEGFDYDLKDPTYPSKLDHNRNIVAENSKYDNLLSKINQAQTEAEIEEIDITQIKENLLTAPHSKQILITAKDTRKNEILNKAAEVLTKAKVQAKSKDADGNDWDPVLTLAEIKQIENTNDLNELSEIQQQFKVTREEFEKIPEPKRDEKILFPIPRQLLSPKQKKVWGEEFLDLEPQQQQKRKKVVEEWNGKDHKNQEKEKKNKGKSVCLACQKSFLWDINLTFNSARKKVEKEVKAHQKICSLMSDLEKTKKVLQEKWRLESKNSRIHNAFSCRKCWGKIYWDKNIPEAVKAKLHAIADLIYHEKHECSAELTKPKIAIYFSSNEGGNEHAPLSYAEKIDESKLMLEKINEMELLQKQVSQNSIVPWIIGGSLLFFVGGFLLFSIIKRREKLIRERKVN